MTTKERISAYLDGYRSGHLDHLLGYRSLYASHSFLDVNEYPVVYGQG